MVLGSGPGPGILGSGPGPGRRSHLADQDLVVVLVGVLAQPVGQVGHPVPQMVHSILTANAG